MAQLLKNGSVEGKMRFTETFLLRTIFQGVLPLSKTQNPFNAEICFVKLLFSQYTQFYMNSLETQYYVSACETFARERLQNRFKCLYF